MAERRPATLPEDMARARTRLERWRRTQRRPGVALPAGLWRAAAELARRHGVSKVARALRLEYYALRQRVDAEAPAAEAGAGFVEVTLASPARMPSCRVELEDGGSTRLKIELEGLTVDELGAVVRSIWSSAR